MKALKEAFSGALLANGWSIDPKVQAKMLVFLEMLLRWNKVFRLTAIDDPTQALWLHILDSLAILPFLHGDRIIDVGSGGGLPGIPLALAVPDKQFVLLDSNGKKTRFMQQVVLELSLPNVTVVQERAEIFRPPEGFDSIITRAFATLQIMVEQTGHLSRAGGRFLAMKGTYPAEELTQLPKEYAPPDVHRLSIVGLDAIRHLVCIQKD
jgi:16S rRNA (guanine527-N7)-methyltransferase